uniref:Uncharacterized protein n=1 Tax=Anguilla anguilla TaxID=7936 RepID=A0A0E9WLR9_ANGAN
MNMNHLHVLLPCHLRKRRQRKRNIIQADLRKCSPRLNHIISTVIAAL